MACVINNDDNDDNSNDDNENDKDNNDKDDYDNQRAGGTMMMGHPTINKRWGLRFALFNCISNNISCLLI